jgi:hypothetical protein
MLEIDEEAAVRPLCDHDLRSQIEMAIDHKWDHRQCLRRRSLPAATACMVDLRIACGVSVRQKRSICMDRETRDKLEGKERQILTEMNMIESEQRSGWSRWWQLSLLRPHHQHRVALDRLTLVLKYFALTKHQMY